MRDARGQTLHDINALARRYLIPLIDVGMTLASEKEALMSALGELLHDLGPEASRGPRG